MLGSVLVKTVIVLGKIDEVLGVGFRENRQWFCKDCCCFLAGFMGNGDGFGVK